MSAIVHYFEHSLALPFFGIWMKTDVFQSCGHCWVFQICWHIECNTFTASSFRIWNSSTGIPSPPLALLIVMLPKAHLTSHSRMSGSSWVITPSWLSGSLRSFLFFFFISKHSGGIWGCQLQRQGVWQNRNSGFESRERTAHEQHIDSSWTKPPGFYNSNKGIILILRATEKTKVIWIIYQKHYLVKLINYFLENAID